MIPRWSVILSIMWLFAILILGTLAPFITPFNPTHPISAPLSSARISSPLGTDSLGRDLWTRLIYGGRYSPGSSLLATLLTLMIGGTTGLLAAALGGRCDRFILAILNAALAIPSLLLAMLLVAGLGPGLSTVILAIGFGGAPGFARVTRTVFLQIRERGFVHASEAFGAGRLWIAYRHLLPNARRQIVSLATTHYAWAFLGITTLTFLGLAGDPALPVWGAMLNEGRSYLIEAPRLAIWPGMAISVTILAVHRLGAFLAGEELITQVR
ncbi:MAG: ABC transporter permease subunit [Anaerolineales bacterium]|nr:ABC transporter permease subunit [Anaerolineales bacterium]